MATFTNRATLTYGGRTVTSNVVTGEIVRTLALSKTAQLPTYGADPVVYIVGMVNSGAAPLTGLTLTDDLGSYEFNGQTLYPLAYVEGSVRLFVNGELQQAPTVETAAGVVFSGIDLPAGGSALLIYSAQPTEYAPRGAGEGVTNSVSASGAGLVEAVSAESTVTVEEGALLTVGKSLSPAEVCENGEIAYTFVIENSGNGAAEEEAQVVLSDLFDPILSDLTVTLDGAPLESGVGYNYDEATGQFDTLPGAILLPAATVTQDETTGAYNVTPSSVTLVVKGTV